MYQHVQSGTEILVRHIKAGQSSIELRGHIKSCQSGLLVLLRHFQGGGIYDGLRLPIEAGDWGTILLQEGAWVKIVPFNVVQRPSDAVRFAIHGKHVAPEEVSAQVLRKLVDDASKFLGEKVTDAVITVPAYFNDAQRQSTRDAGTIAGLNVLRIINKPTAAALAYSMDKRQHQTIMVFDLGGGTFDVSILDVGEGICEVRATSGDTHLGGDDFDKRIVDWLAGEFKRDQGIELRSDAQALQRLYEAAEKAKCELSSATQTQINLPFITADASGLRHLNVTLTRATFEALTRELVERCLAPVKQARAGARISETDRGEVLLVGGSTRIPAVQALIKKLTGGKEPNMMVNPDEVVALGAAVQAAIIKGERKCSPPPRTINRRWTS